MNREQFNKLMDRIDDGTHTVGNQEILSAVGYLDRERLRLQYMVLGPPCGSSSLQALENKTP